MKTQLNAKNSGSAIVVVLSITVTVAAIVAVSMEYTATIRRYVQRSQALQSAVAIGGTAPWKTLSLTGEEFAAQARIFLFQRARSPTLKSLFRHRRSSQLFPALPPRLPPPT